MYSLDVKTFRDTTGNGYGDFQGVLASLDYLHDLGVNALWLQPFHPSPGMDNGYDITDHYGVDPRLGALGDVRALVDAAHRRGIRVVMDMVLDHTSVEHPWFQEACRNPDSPYCDYYLLRNLAPELGEVESYLGLGEHTDTWSRHPDSGVYYYHSFFPFQPDLDLTKPAVQEEVQRIFAFWLDLGVDGFRLDAVPEIFGPYGEERFGDGGLELLEHWQQFVRERRADAVLIGEVDMPPAEYRRYFGSGERLPLLFNFYMTAHVFLALAREKAQPVAEALGDVPRSTREQGYVNFLRSHDELSFRQLDDVEADDAFRAYAPDRRMRIFRRGVRRRLAPLLSGDRRRIEFAFSLLLSLPGAPMIEYGDEIGMGDDLERPERHGIRTPMQWTAGRNGGFSTAPEEALVRDPIREGAYGYPRVNVEAQSHDPASLLSWVRHALLVRSESPLPGRAEPEMLSGRDPSVLALLYRHPEGSLLTVHNFSSRPSRTDMTLPDDLPQDPSEVLADRAYTPFHPADAQVDIGAWGYRWFRL